jgi:hypothetical protein
VSARAQEWLDLARYADTNSYQNDTPRAIWKWREWVINAFNANMPFDQFTIEQLAGDLLPNATHAQKVAAGFNRNHPTNSKRLIRVLIAPEESADASYPGHLLGIEPALGTLQVRRAWRA